MFDGKKTSIDVNCQDYRKTMELLGLRRQMEAGILDPKKRAEVALRIETLEKELQMD